MTEVVTHVSADLELSAMKIAEVTSGGGSHVDRVVAD
jgi:hypothetical protein